MAVKASRSVEHIHVGDKVEIISPTCGPRYYGVVGTVVSIQDPSMVPWPVQVRIPGEITESSWAPREVKVVA